MNAGEAETFFFGCPKIRKALHAMVEVGLSYLSLGQPLSTLSGGERQRVKMAKYLDQKGNIYVLDESTTGLHASDIKKVMELLDGFVKRGNTVIVIEHNMDVVKLADYVIDIGPDGGSMGGEIVFRVRRRKWRTMQIPLPQNICVSHWKAETAKKVERRSIVHGKIGDTDGGE